MRFLTFLASAAFLVRSTAADPVWPSVIDEMEDLMYLTSGYRSRGFADPVVPCSKSPAGTVGRKASAEWIRTAFHDAAPGSVYTNVGGADGSIMFEISRSENAGLTFNSTMNALAPFYNRKASAADLIALGLYTSTRSCGGPVVQTRMGRIDATAAGPNGFIPVPESAATTFVNQFARMGFSTQEMIVLVACGHTVGGVHSTNFPTIVLPASDGSDIYLLDDTTPDTFDNRIVTEWLAGNTTNPLVVGQSVISKKNSDAKVYNVDKNVTMKTLADPAVFASQCSATFQKMVEVVPAGVTLSDPMAPYNIKPSLLQLTLLNGGANMTFSGEIRVRTTVRNQAQIASVQLAYLDRNGGSVNTPIMTSFVGSGKGFDDSFAFYSFSSTIDTTSSISAFNVVVNLVSGTSETHNNNGTGYPISDNIMLQTPQSCVSTTTDANGNKLLTVVAAVRNTLSAANLVMSVAQPRSGVAFPLLNSTTQAMTQSTSVGPYNLFTASYAVPVAQAATMKFDLTSGSYADSFKSTGSLGNTCASLAGGSSTTSSTTTTSPTTSTTSTVTTSPVSSTISSSTTSTSAVVSPTSLACPDNNGVIYTATSGQTFKIECYNDHTAGDLSMQYVDTLVKCVQLCDSTAGCKAFSWASTANGMNNPCYMKSSIGADQTNNGVWGGKLVATSSSSSASTTSTVSSSSTSVASTIISSTSSSSTGSSPLSTTSPTSSSLSLSTSSSTSSVPSATASGWTALGCYADNVNGRALVNNLPTLGGGNNMTNFNCITSAQSYGYIYAGTEYSGECWAANSITNGGGPASDGNAKCNMACNGASGEICGGPDRLTLWGFGVSNVESSSSASISTTTTSSTSTSTSVSVSPSSISSSTTSTITTSASSTTLSTITTSSTSTSATSTPTGWHYLGCYTDLVNGRALTYSLDVSGGSANMTNVNCMAAAQAQGYEYAGTEYSGECWAGSQLMSGSGPAASSGQTDFQAGCSYSCKGNETEICGGASRMTLWGFGGVSGVAVN